MTLALIMTAAHALKREYRCTMSMALRMSWGLARGFTYAVEASFSKDGKIVRRAVFLGNSYEEATVARQAGQRRFAAEGARLFGSVGINLNLYAPAVEVEAVQPVVFKRAA